MGNSDSTYDLSKVTTLRGLMKTLFNFERITRSGMLPAVVTKVNDGHTVDCIILCNRAKIEDGRVVNFKRETVKEVPWMQVMHGGYLIDCPISEGDTGWIIAGDRQNRDIREKNANIDPQENEGPQDLSSYGIGKFEFGLFIPDNWTSDSPAKDGNFTIRNLKKDDKIDTEDVYGVYKKYPWSLIEIEKNGMVNIYGQGKKFTVREEGLYLDDKPLTFEGMTLTGNTEESVKITGDVSVESKLRTEEGEEYDGEIIAETIIDEEATDDSPQKSSLNLNLKLHRKKASALNHDGEEVFTSDIYSENDMLVIPDYGVEFEESTIGEGDEEKPATLVKLLLAEGLGIEITDDDDTFEKKIKNTGVISLTGSGIITVTEGQDGVWNVDAPSPTIPTVNDGVLTIKDADGTPLGTFSANQATDATINLPDCDVNSVDVKDETFGLSITPTTRDVKIENTGATGISVAQSGGIQYFQVTGTAAQHAGVDVLTKDISITFPTLHVLRNVTPTTKVANAIGIEDSKPEGDAQQLTYVQPKILSLDASKANCSLTVGDSEAAKFFGTANVTLAKVASSGSYNDLTDKPEATTKTWTVDGTDITVTASAAATITSNVQADWTEDDYTKGSFINNKPDLCDFIINDVTTGVQFYGTDDCDFGEKNIVGGTGIEVTVNNNTVTISATGETGTSGYTGYVTFISEYDYNHPYLRQHKKKMQFRDGLLIEDGVTDLGWENVTQAVEETV